MPSVRAISDQTGFIAGKLTNRRLIAARTEGSRATLSVPRSSVVAAHLLHELKAHPPGGRSGLLLRCEGEAFAEFAEQEPQAEDRLQRNRRNRQVPEVFELYPRLH